MVSFGGSKVFVPSRLVVLPKFKKVELEIEINTIIIDNINIFIKYH